MSDTDANPAPAEAAEPTPADATPAPAGADNEGSGLLQAAANRPLPTPPAAAAAAPAVPSTAPPAMPPASEGEEEDDDGDEAEDRFEAPPPPPADAEGGPNAPLPSSARGARKPNRQRLSMAPGKRATAMMGAARAAAGGGAKPEDSAAESGDGDLPPPPQHRGWLQKRALNKSNWRARYFTLLGSCLTCYKDAEAREPTRSWTLTPNHEAQPCHVKEHAFELIMGQHALVLQAPDAAARDQWVSVLHDSLGWCGAVAAALGGEDLFSKRGMISVKMMAGLIRKTEQFVSCDAELNEFQLCLYKDSDKRLARIVHLNEIQDVQHSEGSAEFSVVCTTLGQRVEHQLRAPSDEEAGSWAHAIDYNMSLLARTGVLRVQRDPATAPPVAGASR